MHDVGAAWLMTSLSPSPFLVALMQAASSLPFFLLALPAGAIADVVDRRKMLLFTQAWMLAAAALLGVLTVADITTPGILLALTFALSVGSAMNMPVWQTITPELVTKEELPSAVTLSGIVINYRDRWVLL
jgi:MFS family permease